MEEKINYIVKISDNTHYHEADDDVTEGAFETYEAAYKKCEEIVDEALKELYYKGMGSEELFASFLAYGQEPYIECTADKEFKQFSAWKYAKDRTGQLPKEQLD